MSLSPSVGRFKCTADQTHKLSVSRHEKRIERVPLPSGLGTKPTTVVLTKLGLCTSISKMQL